MSLQYPKEVTVFMDGIFGAKVSSGALIDISE